MPKLARIMPIAPILLEGLPTNKDLGFPTKYAGFFPGGETASTPPALGAGSDLGADGVPDGDTTRLRTGVRGVSVALLELLFLRDPSEALRGELMEILKAQAGT